MPDLSRAADELGRQEFARLAAAVTPKREALRSMTAGDLRDEIARMWDLLGHTLHTGPAASELVTTKGERKFLTMCANPADPMPAGSAALRRLRDRIVAGGAERGFFVSVRGFTDDARHFAETAPVQLIDGPEFIRALHRSRNGELLPQTYKAMCRQCGDIVQHRLESDEAKPCGNGHFVVPTIARAELVRPCPAQPATPATGRPTPAPKKISYRNMSPKAQRRRAIKAHNHQLWVRFLKRQHRGAQ